MNRLVLTMSFSLIALLAVLVATQLSYALSVETSNAELDQMQTIHNLATVMTVFGILEAIGLAHVFMAAIFKHLKDDVEF